MFGEKLGKADDGRGKNRILTVPWPLVRELEHFGALHPVHLDLREAVHLQHVHAGNEEADPVARVPRGLGERADLAEIRSRSGDEQNFPRHPGIKPPSRAEARRDLGRAMRRWGCGSVALQFGSPSRREE